MKFYRIRLIADGLSYISVYYAKTTLPKIKVKEFVNRLFELEPSDTNIKDLFAQVKSEFRYDEEIDLITPVTFDYEM